MLLSGGRLEKEDEWMNGSIDDYEGLEDCSLLEAMR